MQILDPGEERPTGPGPEGPGGIREQRALQLAGLAVERYGLPDARVCLLRQGFKQVFRVTSPTGGEFTLRMYSSPPAADGPRTRDDRSRTDVDLRRPQTIRAQLEWLSSLRRDTGLLVPEPVSTADGSPVGYVSFRDLPLGRRVLRRVSRRYKDVYRPDHPGRHSVLLRWVPGERKEDLAPADLLSVGSFVARLHDHAEGYPVAEASSLPRWDWRWPFGESAPVWREGEAFYSPGEMAVFEAASQRVAEDLRTLGEGRDVFGTIHRDLQPDNLVFHGARVGALDFDLCGLGHYLLDLSTLAVSLRVHYADRHEALQDALLEGYAKDRPLPPDYRRYLRTFSAMLATASINRALVLLASGAPPGQSGRGPHFLSNQVKRVDRLLEE